MHIPPFTLLTLLVIAFLAIAGASLALVAACGIGRVGGRAL